MKIETMTNAELREALRSPTPELIQELSKRVWEKMGNCWHNWIRDPVKNDYGGHDPYYRCTKCPAEHWGLHSGLPKYPDITDPATWVPIMEKEFDGYCFLRTPHKNGGCEVELWSDSLPVIKVEAVSTGIAVGLAVLEMEEGK